MPQHPPADQWRSAVWRTLTLRLAVRWSVVYCFAWGIVALAVRVLVTDTATWLWWGGLGLIAVWAAAAWAARRRVPTAERAEALLDRSNRSGGLLMAGRFTGHEEWAATLAPARVPRVTWRGGPTAGALALAAAFAVAALLVPMPDPATASGSLDVDRSLDEMAEQIDTLEEEKVLDADEAEALREAMRQVAEDATGNDPGKTWEALDHLAETVDRAGDEAAELARQRMEEAAGAEALARALADGVGQSGPGGEAGAGEAGEPMEGAGGEAMLTPEQMAAAMGALEQLMQDAAGEPTLDGMQLPEGLAEALQQAGMDGGQDGAQEGGAGLSPEQLQRLAEAMQGRQEQLAELMQALQEAGLGEGGEGSASSEYDPYAELAEIDPEALKEFLAGEGMPGGLGGEEMLQVMRGLVPGRGGITRGPGHADMIWKDPSSEEGATFDPQVLPPARARDLADAQKLGVSRTTPQAEADAATSAGGALTDTAAGGGSAAEAVVLPRHRGAVERYFDRVGE